MTIWRWVTDWRNAAVVIASVLVGLLAVLVVTSINDRGRAIDAATNAVKSEQQLRAAAIARVNELLDEIGGLQTDARRNGAEIAALQAQVDALRRQIRQMGGQPVVMPPPSRPSSSPSRTATPHPTASPSHHPTPAPTPSPSRTLCLPVICGGAR